MAELKITRRSEEEKVLRAPLLLRLGGTIYEVPVLPCGKSRAWRKQLVEAFSGLELAGLQVNGVSEFLAALPRLVQQVMMGLPEAVGDLVFAYCPALPREEIEAEATDEEMAQAFLDILGAALPFGRVLRALKDLAAALPKAPEEQGEEASAA